MGSTPQDRGRAFEEQQSDLLGLKRVPGSGNGRFKLDLTGRELRLSLKRTDKASFRVDEGMLQELDDATSGPGGAGASVTALLVIEVAGIERTVAVIDWEDMVGLLKSDAVGSIEPTKDEQRRAQADLPSYLRD